MSNVLTVRKLALSDLGYSPFVNIITKFTAVVNMVLKNFYVGLACVFRPFTNHSTERLRTIFSSYR